MPAVRNGIVEMQYSSESDADTWPKPVDAGGTDRASVYNLVVWW
jgi:hypothetical protein